MVSNGAHNVSLGVEQACFDLSHAFCVAPTHRFCFGQTAGTGPKDQKIVTSWQS
jgi:hypothetical protein